MKALSIFSLLVLMGFITPAFADPVPNRPYTFVGNCDPSRILRSTKMKQALSLIAKKSGTKLQLFSCYRSQTRQNNIRRRRGCLGRKCSSVASRSQHTYGIAADFHLNKGKRGNCQLMDQVRKELLGGRGGIGAYSATEVHFDVRDRPSAWVGCAGFVNNNITGNSKVVDRFLDEKDPFINLNDRAAMDAGARRRLAAEAAGYGYDAGEDDEGHTCTDIICGLFRWLFGG